MILFNDYGSALKTAPARSKIQASIMTFIVNTIIFIIII